MQNIRTLDLGAEALYVLARNSADTPTSIENCDTIAGVLPYGLSPDEVAHVGDQISQLAELHNPSSDRMSNGAKARIKTIRGVGEAALANGDLMTAESSAYHLLSRYKFSGFRGYLLLKHGVNKQFRQIW